MPYQTEDGKVAKFAITANDEKSPIAQFRVWATKRLEDHLIKGFAMNDERLLQA